MSTSTRCAQCGARGAANVCGRCKVATYCDVDCQRAAWRAGHKAACAAADLVERHVDVAASPVGARAPPATLFVRQPAAPAPDAAALRALVRPLAVADVARPVRDGTIALVALLQSRGLPRAALGAQDMALVASTLASGADPYRGVDFIPLPPERRSAASCAMRYALAAADAPLVAALTVAGARAAAAGAGRQRYTQPNGDIVDLFTSAFSSPSVPAMVAAAVAAGADAAGYCVQAAMMRVKVSDGADGAFVFPVCFRVAFGSAHVGHLTAADARAVLKTLARAGASLDATDGDGWTLVARLAAAAAGCKGSWLDADVALAMLGAALDAGASPNTPLAAPEPPLRPLDLIAHMSDGGEAAAAAARALLKAGADASPRPFSFARAIEEFNWKIGDASISRAPQADVNTTHWLAEAVYSTSIWHNSSSTSSAADDDASTALLRFALSEARADANTRMPDVAARTLLHLAAAAARPAAARALLAAGARATDVSTPGFAGKIYDLEETLAAAKVTPLEAVAAAVGSGQLPHRKHLQRALIEMLEAAVHSSLVALPP